MALEYVVTKRVFGFDKDKNEKYVAKSVRSGRVNFAKICRKVSQLCGVHRKVVDLVVSESLALLSVQKARMKKRKFRPSQSFRERFYSIRGKSSKIRWRT